MSNQQEQQPYWTPQQQSAQHPSPYQQLPQYQRPYFQQLVYYPPPQLDKPKNRTMKTMAIVSFSIGLFLAFLSTIPTVGIVFGFFGFFCNVMGLIFLCCI